MNLTSEKKELKGTTIFDSRSYIRNDFLKKWFPNSVDGIRYYAMMGEMSQKQLIGNHIKKALYLYYRYIHTNSIILPLKDIEEIIWNASDIDVDPCPCRLSEAVDACDAPLYTCMRINNSAKIRKEQKDSKGLTKEEAIEIARNANKHGLVMSLESCIQPYQNNICMCCTDCCIAMKSRYHYNIPIYHSGPYLPEFDVKRCVECGMCVEHCPVHALSEKENYIDLNLDDCFGCGLCCDACPQNAITMVKKSKRVRVDQEPNFIQFLLISLYIYLIMIPSVTLFKLFKGSKKYLQNSAPRPNDVDFIKQDIPVVRRKNFIL